MEEMTDKQMEVILNLVADKYGTWQKKISPPNKR